MKRKETPGLPSNTMFVDFVHKTIDCLTDAADVFAADTACPDDTSLATFLSDLTARPAVVSVLPLFAKAQLLPLYFAS